MKVSELGEFGLIDILNKMVQEAKVGMHEGLEPSAIGHDLVIGIGDDAAAWRPVGYIELATTDTMVQDIHFKVGFGSWSDIGWKALAVNISDIAAMGGEPTYALITLGLPVDTEVENIRDLYDGLIQASKEYGLAIAGGDIVRSLSFFVTVALMGRANMGKSGDRELLLRSAAAPGDLVAVTGFVGSSAGGLRCLRGQGKGKKGDRDYLAKAHLRPTPRVSEGRAAVDAGVKCAMDVSDGTVADLSKLCTASGVSAVLYSRSLPVHPSLKSAFPEEWLSLALFGGEDYELLFAASEERISTLQSQIETSVSAIGRIEAGKSGSVTIIGESGDEVLWEGGGWDHLKDK